MADEMVRTVQNWLNENYEKYGGRYNPIEPDGITGLATVRALIRALQIELGIASTADTFGPTTEREFNNQIGFLEKDETDSPPTNINFILQGAFYCKGYNPGGFTGNFYTGTESAVRVFQSDIGLEKDGKVTAKVFKALLNTDGYKLSSNYRAKSYIREIQQELNRTYAYQNRKWFFDYVPTNGIYDRNTNTALIYALQIEEGLEDVANGNFGPSTIAECPILNLGDSGPLVKILQWALACNGEDYKVDFSGIYDSATKTAVTSFQEFMALPVTGIAEIMTIKQLLTSNGYTNRIATVCDTSYIIDLPKAQTLKEYGYEIVGRYLTGYVSRDQTRVSKALTPLELTTITHSGLRVFPIYQDGGYEREYFVSGKGTEDAYKALNAAWNLGFPNGTTIYFAVDFDAYDYDVTDLLLPYFREIRDVFKNVNEYESEKPQYRIGVYGSRNTCSRVRSEVSTTINCFVSDMSTGYSGNLGYPMPNNWTFDQFFEQSIGSGEGRLDIDKCGYSGLDQGVSSVDYKGEKDPEDVALMNKWIEIASQIPFLKEATELLVPEFEFNTEYTLTATPWVEISLETQTTFNPSDIDDGIQLFTVRNGRFITANINQVLGEDFKNEVSIDAYKETSEALESVVQTLDFGQIGFQSQINNNIVECTFKIIEEEIPVGLGDRKVNLAINLNISVDNTLFNQPLKKEFSPAAVIITILLLLLEILSLVVFKKPLFIRSIV